MNSLAQNMFSCDVKCLSFRYQTFKFSRPTVKEDDSNQQERKKLSERRPTFNDLRNQVKELAHDHSFSEVGRILGCSLKIVKHYTWAGKLPSLTPETQTCDIT